MVRYTIALKGQAKDPKHEIQVQEEEVNIQKGEQLTEHYLCDINACGEVRPHHSGLSYRVTNVRTGPGHCSS